MTEDDFMDKYEAAKFNSTQELQGADHTYMIDQVIIKINEELMASLRKDSRLQKSKPAFNAEKRTDFSPAEILKLIDVMRQHKLSQQMGKMTPEEKKAMVQSQNFKQSYSNRKSRGQPRYTFNKEQPQIPGHYNSTAKVEIVEEQQVHHYDKFSLTVIDRAQHMHAQF